MPVAVRIAALPATPTVTLPPDTAILTLLVPFDIDAPPPPPLMPVNWDPLPNIYAPVIFADAVKVLAEITLAPVILPVEPDVVKLFAVTLPVAVK